ncbi:MAG: AsmA family protein [Bacteroidetes bacterium]|nr:MAG: AsmA family protein [Bacteroidota bacterium]
MRILNMKKIVLIFSLVVVLFLGFLLAAPFLFKGKILSIIKEQINENVNAKVNFSDDLDLSLIRSFPNLSLQINDIEVVGVDSFAQDTLLRMKTFAATLDIMSVISGDQIRIKRVLLESPDIHAVILPSGRANWDIAKPSTDTSTTEESDSSSGFQIALKSYELSNANIVYDDQEAEMYAAVLGLNHKGSGDFTQDNFILETLTQIKSLTYRSEGLNYLTEAEFDAKVDIDMNLPQMRFGFKDNNFRLNALEIGLDGFVAMPNDAIEMDLNLKSNKVSFKELLSLIPAIYQKDFADLETKGETSLTAQAKGVYNSAIEAYPAFNLKLLVQNAMFKYPALPEALNNVNIDLEVANADGILDHTVTNLKKLHVELGQEPFDAHLLVRNPMTDPNLDMGLKGSLQLDRIVKLVPLEEGTKLSGKLIADMVAKGRVSQFSGDDYENMNVSGNLIAEQLHYEAKDLPTPFDLSAMELNFQPKEVKLPKFEAKLGHSDISLNGSLQNFFGYLFKPDEVLKGQLELSSSLLDANAFMSDEGDQNETPAPEDTVAMQAVEIPANIDFNFRIKGIDKVLYDNLELKNVQGTAHVHDAMLDLTGVRLGIFDGQVELNGKYDTRDKQNPATAVKVKLSEVDIQQSFNYMNSVQKLAPIAKYLNGKVNAEFGLETLLGQDMSPVLSSLTSDGFFKTSKAVLSGFTPMNTLADRLKLNDLKEVLLTNTNVSYEVADGKVKLKNPVDFKVGNIGVRVLEEGYTTFEQGLNYVMKLDVPASVIGGNTGGVLDNMLKEVNRSGTDLKAGERLNINALVGGTIQKPEISTSLKDIGKDALNQVKDQAKQVIDNKKQEAIDKANAAKAKLIADAEAKGDALITEAHKKADQLKAEAKKQGDALIAEADKRAEQLVKDAGANPVKKEAARRLGEVGKKEAREKAAALNAAAEKQGNELIGKAESEKARLVAEASK